MKTRTSIAMALALAGLSAGALADHGGTDLSYDLLEYRYQESELDGGTFEIDGDGYAVNGSLEISDSLHVFGGFDKLTFDDDVELQTRVLGIGWAFDLSARTDLFLRAGVVDAEFEDPQFRQSADGSVFTIGIRSFVRDDIELYGNHNRFRFDDIDDEESTTVGLDFYLNESFVVGPALNWVEDTTTWSIGGKFYF